MMGCCAGGRLGSWGPVGMGLVAAGADIVVRASCSSCMVVCQVVDCGDQE
jgi:hypothetical protein